MLITISGIDSAGKSTQIELLSRQLGASGSRKLTVIWHRPGYSSALNSLRSLVRRISPRALPTGDQAAAREAAFGRPWIQRAWVLLALMDTFWQYSVKVRALRALGKTVICDRYIEDAQLDLTLRFPDLDVKRRRLTRLVRASVSRPTAAILLTIGWDEMIERMNAKQEPFPDPPDIRRKRFEAYEDLAGSGRFHVVDAARPTELVLRDVLRTLDGKTQQGGN